MANNKNPSNKRMDKSILIHRSVTKRKSIETIHFVQQEIMLTLSIMLIPASENILRSLTDLEIRIMHFDYLIVI